MAIDREQSGQGFGRHGRSAQQSPLVVDAKQERSRERRATSRLERRWPVYLGVITSAITVSIVAIPVSYQVAVGMAWGGSAILLLLFTMAASFGILSLFLIYIFSSVRSSAEALGNLTFLSESNMGFKIGAALGLGLFLWFTPIVFGDPFAGNRSAPSAIVAQLILKALALMGFLGAIGSKLEERLRPRSASKTQ